MWKSGSQLSYQVPILWEAQMIPKEALHKIWTLSFQNWASFSALYLAPPKSETLVCSADFIAGGSLNFEKWYYSWAPNLTFNHVCKKGWKSGLQLSNQVHILDEAQMIPKEASHKIWTPSYQNWASFSALYFVYFSYYITQQTRYSGLFWHIKQWN